MNTAKIDIILEFATIGDKKKRGAPKHPSQNYYY